MKIALVGCGKEKRRHAAPARDLYTGPLFCAARAWAEAFADRWYILSAKHGLLAPDTVIEPYDLKLSALSREDRIAWAQSTADALIAAVPDDQNTRPILLAGVDYTSALIEHGSGRWRWRTLEPLAGLELGPRLAWFKRAMVAGRAIQRMRAAEAEGAFGRCELSAAECTALFDAGLACGTFFDPLGIYAIEPDATVPDRVGAGVQLTFGAAS